MSIYACWLAIDDDDHEPECAKWRMVTKAETEGEPSWMSTWAEDYYLPVPDATCTCGSPGPIVYQGSHVNPDDADARGGSVDLSAIPNHCHPDVRGTDDEGSPVEFLRLSVSEDAMTYHGMRPGQACVVLDRPQIERMRDTLTAWLDSRERT